NASIDVSISCPLLIDGVLLCAGRLEARPRTRRASKLFQAPPRRAKLRDRAVFSATRGNRGPESVHHDAGRPLSTDSSSGRPLSAFIFGFSSLSPRPPIGSGFERRYVRSANRAIRRSSYLSRSG